jgi:hypothetical protein
MAISRPSYSFGQNTVDPQYFPRTNVSIFETMYINRSRHDIKLGADITVASSNFEAHFTEHGQFIFTTDTPFDAITQPTWPQSFVQQTPGYYNYKSNQIAAFFQDDWRVRDNMRLNLGVRYDVDTNLRNNDFYYSLLANPKYAGLSTFVSSDRGNEVNNIQPRLGFTWDTKRNGTMVFRLWEVRHTQPAVVPGNVDGQVARVGGAYHRSEPAEVLPGHQRRAWRQKSRRLRGGGRRPVVVSDRRQLQAAVRAQHHGGPGRAAELGHVT